MTHVLLYTSFPGPLLLHLGGQDGIQLLLHPFLHDGMHTHRLRFHPPVHLGGAILRLPTRNDTSLTPLFKQEQHLIHYT